MTEAPAPDGPAPATSSGPSAPNRVARAARWLRVAAGIDEHLLDQVPTERSRYTSLGALVVGTATIGTVSMWVGLNEVSDAGGLLTVLLLLPALLWGSFVLVMDRALITSAGGTAWWSRFPALLVRFALAGVLGLVIAEPLVLQLFHSAIEQDIRDHRAAEVDALRDRLLRCNPVPGSDPAPAGLDCAGALIDTGTAFTGTAGRLATLRTQETDLQQQVSAVSAENARLVDVAQKECAGTGGPGLTGVPGRGFECNQDYQAASDYAASHPLAPLNARLTTVRDEIGTLGGEVADGANAFEKARDPLIDKRVQQLVDHQGGIGLLERFTSLSRLVDAQPALWLREWFIRIVLVLIDVLPVLVKFLGGATAYDRTVDSERAADRAVHQATCSAREAAVISRLDLERKKWRAEHDAEIRRIDDGIEADEDQRIERRRDRYRRATGRTSQAS